MIDPVNISARHIAGTSAAENKKVQPKVAAAPSAVPAEKVTADVSSLESKVAVADMAKTPPIEMEAEEANEDFCCARINVGGIIGLFFFSLTFSILLPGIFLTLRC